MSSYIALQLFGPGLVVDAHGQALGVRSRKQLALLAYLAVEHRTVHSRESLMALLWPDDDVQSAQNNLRVTLSRLRELSAKIDLTAADLLLTDRHTVQLRPDWVERVDVNQYSQLLAHSLQHTHTRRSQCTHCQTALLDAIHHYRADFLTGFGLEDCPAFEEWVFMQRERLRMPAIEAYTDLAIYAEANDNLIAADGYVQHQIAMDSLREPAYRQLMRIQFKRGERSAALATFERCRALLKKELGIEPDLETQRLHAQILAGSMQLGAGPTLGNNAATNTEATSPHATMLPQQLTPFFGRDEELAQLSSRLTNTNYRLLSIIGPGGIGKSRLSQQVAAQHVKNFSDGVFVVALAQVPNSESIPAAIAEALGLSFVAGPKRQIEQLAELIGHKSMLLVLDNFEHLMDGVGLLVTLLRQTTHTVLLVTSRERLNIQAEDLFELQGLPTPDDPTHSAASQYAAVRLFVDRAHRMNKQFKLTPADLPYVVRICQLVEGFPLGIELAATWVDGMACQEIADELSAGLARLETTLRDIDPQHRSLRAAFESSWRLLSAAEQHALATLSVFRGGFDTDAAKAIAEASPVLLNTLRHKSLLRSAGPRRYDMHALVQQFSAEALADDAQVEAQRVHSEYYLARLSEQAIPLDTRQARTAADGIQIDWENVAMAWRWAATHHAISWMQGALDGLLRFCNLRGLFQDAQTLLESARAHLEAAPSALTEAAQAESSSQNLLCRLLTGLAYFAGRRGLESTIGLSQKALEAAYKVGNQNEVISNHIILAAASELAGNYSRSTALAEHAMQLAQTQGAELQVGLCQDVLGIIALQTGQFDHANTYFQSVVDIHRRTGRIEQRARAAVGYLGSVTTEQGRYDLALTYQQQYLESCEAMDDRRNTALASHYLAYLWLRLGYYEKTIAIDTQSAIRASRIGDREVQSLALHCVSWAHRHLGQSEEALTYAVKSVALARELNAPLLLGYALVHLAEAQIVASSHERDWKACEANFREASRCFRSIGKLIMAYEADIGLAELARRRGMLSMAHDLIVPILPHLPSAEPHARADGWDEPIRAYLVCTQILHALRDPSAVQLLAQGLQLLDQLAHNIIDPNLRQNFLSAVPANRNLRDLQLRQLSTPLG